MGRKHRQIVAQIALEEMLAILVDIRHSNDIVKKQALTSGSFDRIFEEALIQEQRLNALKAQLSRKWYVVARGEK